MELRIAFSGSNAGFELRVTSIFGGDVQITRVQSANIIQQLEVGVANSEVSFFADDTIIDI